MNIKQLSPWPFGRKEELHHTPIRMPASVRAVHITFMFPNPLRSQVPIPQVGEVCWFSRVSNQLLRCDRRFKHHHSKFHSPEIIG